jgi:hypothetical protein
VFIIGAPFSGCNALMWALAQHTAIAPLVESEWLNVLTVAVESVFSVDSASGGATQLGALGVNRGHLSGNVGEAVRTMLATAPAGSASLGASRGPRWVTTNAECGHHVFGLWQLFPHARFIHVLRDVQEVVHSLTNFGRIAGVPQTEHAAYEAWSNGVDACVRAERAFGSGTVLRVQYRDLVNDRRAAIQRCFEFIGEACTEGALWPLQLLGDEPRLGDSYHLADMEMRDRAKERCRDLIAEGEPRYEKNQDRIMALKAVYLDRCVRPRPAPRSVRRRIRETVALHLPSSARIAVVSRGDDALLDLADCRGEHFPQGTGGEYAGYHPADSAAAITHLEELHARGAAYLLIPENSFWWLDHYKDFATFLSERCQIIAFVEQTCAIFALHPINGPVLRFTPPETRLASAAPASSPAAGPSPLLEPRQSPGFHEWADSTPSD